MLNVVMLSVVMLSVVAPSDSPMQQRQEKHLTYCSFFQVVDFLSGKAPLNLTMRLGDHMMLIQLQLSTVNSASNSKRARSISFKNFFSRQRTSLIGW
jgi:hypothetical protein